jgi:hypothetical protein
MTDRLDGQLLTLSRVEVPPAPTRAAFEAIVERNRVQRARTRLAAAGLAIVALLGTGALATGVLRSHPDVATDVGAGPDVNNPDAGGNTNTNDVATPDEGGAGEACGLAGPGSANAVPPDGIAEVSDVLEARFPSCFGGIVRQGPTTADVYVVGEVAEVFQAAQQLLPGYDLTLLPSDNTMADVRAMKEQIDDDAGQLHAAGIQTHGTGIRIGSDGPRVYVGLSPYTPEAAHQLEESYGADFLLIEEFGEVIPGG